MTQISCIVCQLRKPTWCFQPLSIIWAHSEAAELQVQVEDLRLVLTSPEDGVLELTAYGEVDLATVEPLRDAADRATKSGSYSLLVFDLEHVTFMDSTGMHVLADTSRRMRAAGGAVEVVCSTPALRKVFTLMGLDLVLSLNELPRAEGAVAV